MQREYLRQVVKITERSLAAGLVALALTGCGAGTGGPDAHSDQADGPSVAASPPVAPAGEDREIAGIRCSEVRRQLKPFGEGELEIDVRQKIADHLRDCPDCMAAQMSDLPAEE